MAKKIVEKWCWAKAIFPEVFEDIVAHTRSRILFYKIPGTESQLEELATELILVSLYYTEDDDPEIKIAEGFDPVMKLSFRNEESDDDDEMRRASNYSVTRAVVRDHVLDLVLTKTKQKLLRK